MPVCWCVQLMLIIDSREQYSNAGRERADGLAGKIQVIRDRGISVEIRALQQGDVLWIAHSRYHAILALQHHDSLSGFVIQPEQRTSHAVLWIAPSRFHFECLQFSILSVLLTHNLSRRPHQACAVLHGILHGSIQNTSLLP